MNITNFKESLEYLTKAELTAFIWGHAGIGKSSIVRQYAESKGWHFFPLYLGTQSDLGDVLGLADFVRDESGNAVATTFATPKWLKDTIDYCKENPDSGAIIFLDEFNRARRDILQGMFSLALDKTFHTIKLPKNCHIIAAGNPPTDEYFTTDVNETALMARFVHVKLEPTLAEWVNYSKDKGLEPSLIGFIQEQPQLLEDAKSTFDLPVKVDRRSFERLGKLFSLKTPKHLLDLLMPGIIGFERTVAYQQYLKESDKPLTPEEVMNKSRHSLVEKWSKSEDVAASFLNITCDNLKTYFKELDTNKTTLKPSEMDNFMDFLMTVPKDVAYPLLSDLVKSQNKAFRAFSTEKGFMEKLKDLALSSKGLK